MTDIDFDELDRAVNSVLSDTDVKAVEPKAESPIEPAAPKVEQVPSVVASPPKPEAAEPAVIREVPKLNREPGTSLVPRRSTGRFMDVVHPSSDMRPASSQPVTPDKEPVGKTIEPSKPEIKEMLMPDPIDVHEKQVATEKPEVATEPPVVEEVPAPAESPFLADAKVEKRPLGAFSETPAPEEVPMFEHPDESNDHIEDHPIETDTHLPAELQKDVLRIEGDSTTKDAAVTVTPVAPMAIEPQYKEQPSTTDKSSGSIYDTKEYHAALMHPAKKKSGWMTVFWTILIIGIGGAVGAGAYFFMLAK